MKNFLLVALLVSAFSIAAAQQLPNNSFEQWTTGLNADPVGYVTLDQLFLADLVSKSTDAYDGSFSVKLETQDLIIGRVPGIMFLSSSPSSFTFGMPYTAKPTKLKGWTKHTIPGMDSATFAVTLTRYNASAEQTDVVAAAQAIFTGNQNSWTPFEVTFEYASTESPDTIIVLAGSSITDSVNTQLSSIWFDNIILEGVAGSLVFNPIEVNLLAAHPNPTAGAILVYTPEFTAGDLLVVTDLSGRVVLNKQITDTNTSLLIDNPGVYLLEMKNAQGLTLKRSRIIKQ